MLLVETQISDFKTVQDCMNDLFPQIDLELISDYTLLGSSLPYSFTMSIRYSELDDIMEDLIQLEIDAFNTEDGKMPQPSNPCYLKYVKYGWLWDLFAIAMEHGDIKEIS